ncbi:adenylate/guanylate cyclase domain-containing protein [Rhizobium beringeri]|uniref:Adenylate/guanylate cyclase domain-containing protein n=1 Tax=Rhizobium beringeri TaxID=3019934 RepID=A0ABY1XVJ4_9HYPH|nr:MULTISPECIES: adenylate/guanylate cyclase domain-containing protein [Rhizobium]TBC73617.1 adenylate/guanylate cyclase domain-containing protein [Rhizobium leguminosarum]TBE71488.1 adenylate/guanylate cyclase domain-containing protein [Rhizobium beringeri]WSG72865.1 adenylate/guanylate cyclase domain-containing protein [Rhizobium beringeri]WSH13060.1 adenylate/guanylate cyclase domain-containing protein [Rhizobium beringeri]WSH49460.1 adenylate/guanylate cyclase domain-containing protein [Rh
MERRLAAILIADVVGYSRLSQIDEEGTRVRFQADLNDVFEPAIERHHGRLVKTMGDGLLVEFQSVVDALRCAVEVQQLKATQSAAVLPERRLEFRIGINLGDIIVEGEDIQGDGVNIADRIQALAEPGGIAISGTTYDQVKSKIPVGFASLGEQRLKSITEPVRVYRVLLDPTAAGKTLPSPRRPPRRRLLAGIAAAVVLALAGAALWWQPWMPAKPPGPGERFAYPLPDRPSVAVLPFINVSGDTEHDHLAEGLTDDLITELSKVSGLFVIARHSVFAIQDSVGKIQDVAAELGVQYVLEGTLQRAGPRLRINVKLIDAVTGLSLWAERYDRQYADLFAVQDDVIGKIISALSVKLSARERDQLARIPTENLEAYDYYMRAEQEGFIFRDVDTYRRTLSFYQKAIDLDPGFANAHAGIARVAVDVWRNDYNYLWSAAVARKIAYDAAGQALKLDPNNARAHTVLALLQWVDGRETEARNSANMAVAMEPNDAEAAANLALILVHTGSSGQAVTEMEKALRLDPSPASSFQLLAGIVFYTAGDDRRAISLIEPTLDSLPKVEPAREYLAAAYADQGNETKAAAETAKLLELFPESNLTYYGYLYDYWRDGDLQRHLAGLRKAGIPEWPFGFTGNQADRLGEAELRNLVDGKSWTGKHKNGTDFIQYFDKAGNTAYRSANTNITGIVEVRGDRICEKFDGYFLDRMVCGYVYRNTSGEQGDRQYIHVTPRALTFFSPVP